MKKYVLLVLVSLIMFTGLTFVYMQTKSNFLIGHQALNEILSEAKQSETTLDRDLLRIQSFLLNNYDAIVVQSSNLEKFCSLQESKPEIYSYTSEDFKGLFKDYCTAIKRKIASIESFKSQYAIYRNSLIFLHGKASSWNEKRDEKPTSLEMYATNATLNYALLSQGETKKIANNLLESFRKNKSDRQFDQTTQHASKILSAKYTITQLTGEIINSPSGDIFEKLQSSFYIQYAQEQERASFYQNLLFSLSMILLVSIIYNVQKIWKAAQDLQSANVNLETRVKERTEALVASQKTIMDQQQTVNLVKKMSALGEMAGGVAHEINTPLAVIQMRADQLLEFIYEEPLDKEMITTAVSAIDITIKRISKIVNGLRSFARDGSKDSMTPYSITKIVEDTFSLCREKFNSHGVQLDYICPADVEFDCRPGEISQVLLNFLNNSYDAIQVVPEKWIKIEVMQVESFLQLSIIDSGSGIPIEIQEKIMQPFFSTKEIGKGTGLGLSISRGIVESHGGKIELNAKSANTQFIISFPKISKQSKSA